MSDGEQVPALQVPWLLMFAEQLAAAGYDPRQFQYFMAGGFVAEVFAADAEMGLNWRMVDRG